MVLLGLLMGLDWGWSFLDLFLWVLGCGCYGWGLWGRVWGLLSWSWSLVWLCVGVLGGINISMLILIFSLYLLVFGLSLNILFLLILLLLHSVWLSCLFLLVFIIIFVDFFHNIDILIIIFLLTFCHSSINIQLIFNYNYIIKRVWFSHY